MYISIAPDPLDDVVKLVQGSGGGVEWVLDRDHVAAGERLVREQVPANREGERAREALSIEQRPVTNASGGGRRCGWSEPERLVVASSLTGGSSA